MVAPIDPLEGQRYVKLINSEGQGDYLDHIYNVMSLKDEYMKPKTNGNLSWMSVISCTSNSGEGLENWKNRMHEVSVRIFARITRSVRWVGVEASELPTYEGFPNLAPFLTKFEAKFTKSQ